MRMSDLNLQVEIARRLRPEIEATAARLVELIEARGAVTEDTVRRIAREIASDISAEARWRMMKSNA